MVPAGVVSANFTSSFEGAGINQTIHRLYLDVNCDVSILTPYGGMSSEVDDKVLFAENIIVGEVPQSFYNLEGISPSDTLPLMTQGSGTSPLVP
ncbi:MAG: sporulation protein YunB [Oscillospiraceae bacterium]|nr:sporulation protein YunB [Oscillospiraceae bacterium]